eukprot:11196694-Lingulodinium_polyedra.AAC.1
MATIWQWHGNKVLPSTRQRPRAMRETPMATPKPSTHRVIAHRHAAFLGVRSRQSTITPNEHTKHITKPETVRYVDPD